MGITTEGEFTALYREHYDDLLRFVRRRAHSSTIDDIVGETFLTAWRRRADLPADARPWLFRTARNIMLNADRGLNRQNALAVRIASRDETTEPSSADARIDLQKAWRALSADEQEVLALGIWEDLPQSQAAAVIGCSRAAYAMRLTRAKRHLSALIEGSPALSALPATN